MDEKTILDRDKTIAKLVTRVVELEDAAGWISVREKIPDVNEAVLTYSTYGKDNYHIGFYVYDSNKKPVWVDDTSWNDIYPDYWMPLPKPPTSCEEK